MPKHLPHSEKVNDSFEGRQLRQLIPSGHLRWQQKYNSLHIIDDISIYLTQIYFLIFVLHCITKKQCLLLNKKLRSQPGQSVSPLSIHRTQDSRQCHASRYGGFHELGNPLYRWMVYFMENPTYKWMRTRGTPILGNLHTVPSENVGVQSRSRPLLVVCSALWSMESIVDEYWLRFGIRKLMLRRQV